MAVQQATNEITDHLRKLTFRGMYANGARSESFAYVWKHRMDPARIEERIIDKEEIYSEPSVQSSPSGSVTSVSAYREGSLPGLRDALKCLRAYSTGEQSNGTTDAELAVTIYRSILQSEARSEAHRFAWTHIEDLNSIKDWVEQIASARPDLFLVKIVEPVIRTEDGTNIPDEDVLRNSITRSESLRIYYEAYLDALMQVLQVARELGVEEASTEAKC